MARPSSPPCYERHRPEDTVLYGTLEGHLEAFLAGASEQGGGEGLPAFVTRELRASLRCGRLEHGCVHVTCERYGDEMVVAFSGKGRGFCPSCGGRRMSELAARLVDRVIPQVPVRQWVLSLPFTLRDQLAFDAQLTSAVLDVFICSVFAGLRRAAARAGIADGQCGAITAIQRCGSALNVNVHGAGFWLLERTKSTGAFRVANLWRLPPVGEQDCAGRGAESRAWRRRTPRVGESFRVLRTRRASGSVSVEQAL